MDENNKYFNNLENVPTRQVSVSNMARTNNAAMKLEKKSGKGLFFGGMLTGLAGALLIAGIVYLGVWAQDTVEGKGNEEVELAEGYAVDADTISKLQTLEEVIEEYFYLGEVTDEEFRDGIYKGMLQALGDDYSEYYTEEELNNLLQQVEGTYYGIGAYVSLDTVSGLPKISGTIKGAPAEEADLRANDIIYEVDGTSTYGLSLDEVVSLIKGEENTDVVLTIYREGENDYLYITVTRRQVETPTIEHEMLDDGMAYISISEFDEVSVTQFRNALKDAEKEGMKGLIVDVRANPGGSLNAVVEMLRMILPEGLIVYTEDVNGEREEFYCDGKNELDVPLVVLVDMNSASASEIFAAAVKDHELGTLVGTTTFGKGIVQQIIPFRDGTAIKLTISAYYTPKGYNIHGTGVEPDIICEFDGDAYYDEINPVDTQLEKAKEVLKELMK